MFIASCCNLRASGQTISALRAGRLLRRTTAEVVVLSGAGEDVAAAVQRHLEHPYRVDGADSGENIALSVVSAHPLESHHGHRIVAGGLLPVTVHHPSGDIALVAADLVETEETSIDDVRHIWRLLTRHPRGILAGEVGFNPHRPLPAFNNLAVNLVGGHGTWLRAQHGTPPRGLLLLGLEDRGGGTYQPGGGGEIHWARIS